MSKARPRLLWYFLFTPFICFLLLIDELILFGSSCKWGRVIIAGFLLLLSVIKSREKFFLDQDMYEDKDKTRLSVSNL